MIHYQNFITKSHPAIHVSTSSSLLRLNLQDLDDEFIERHNIHHHSMIISEKSLDLGDSYVLNDG